MERARAAVGAQAGAPTGEVVYGEKDTKSLGARQAGAPACLSCLACGYCVAFRERTRRGLMGTGRDKTAKDASRPHDAGAQ